MIAHVLKTWPQFFALVWDGIKTFEIRENDRNFQRYEKLILREWTPPPYVAHDSKPGIYSGRVIEVDIKHVLHDAIGVKAGHVILLLDMRTKLLYPLDLGGKPSHPKFHATALLEEGLT